MGHDDGFKRWPRAPAPRRPVAERLGDWREVYVPHPSAREQGGRCMDCGVPFCMQGCPLGNRIPDWNDLVHGDRWQAAFEALDDTNNLPEVTGRLCPAPCEASCVLAINDDAVTIEHIEKEIAEMAFARGWVTPRPPTVRTGHRVAVVGSGPAGLAAAQQLNRAGHHVVVFDKADRAGGLLRYGIPDFKMEKWVIDRRLEVLVAEGITFRTGVDVGNQISWSELKADFDAVLLAVGAEAPRDLDVPGRDLDGVHLAMDYLVRNNHALAGDAVDPIDAKDRHVVILGGGDTGSDCLGTALRQGAASATTIHLYPAPPPSRSRDDLWPAWPLVFRVSTSQEEGGAREWALRTTRLEGRDGKVARLVAVKCEVIRQGGTRTVLDTGDPVALDCDLLLLAIGFEGPVTGTLVDQLGIALDDGRIAVDAGYRTSVPGFYCAGDAKRGADLIVWAIAEGREAARTIDADLVGAERLPTRGADRPFAV